MKYFTNKYYLQLHKYLFLFPDDRLPKQSYDDMQPATSRLQTPDAL